MQSPSDGEKIAELQGQIRGAKWTVLATIGIVTLFAGLYATNVRSIALENKRDAKEQSHKISKNSEALQRYDASIQEQNRRLNRIEEDIRDIKNGQNALIRKIDRIFIDRGRTTE